MSSNEARELKIWIQIHVFGWKHSAEKKYPHRRGFSKDGVFLLEYDMPDYPNDDGAAFSVLERCATECESSGDGIDISFTKQTGEWEVGRMQLGFEWSIELRSSAQTLPLAICLFAKKLFTP